MSQEVSHGWKRGFALEDFYAYMDLKFYYMSRSKMREELRRHR